MAREKQIRGTMKVGSGFFISFEGPDGCGKSTLVPLLGDWLSRRGWTVTLTREPGGTSWGSRVRELLLQGDTPLTPLTEALLMAADRAQHVAEVIRPALSQGQVVISDRYLDSSIAYQGYAAGGPVTGIRCINEQATEGLLPDVTFLLDVALDEIARRRQRAGDDRFERRGAAFQERVINGFRRLAAEEPERFVVIQNEGDPVEVCERIGRIVAERMSGLVRS